MFSGMSGMFMSIDLDGFLENFKETMEEGDKNLGVPVLEPFVKKRLDINSEETDLFSATGRLKNLRIEGLSDYLVEKADFLMDDFKAKVTLLFHKINIETRYKMRGTFLDENSYDGHGHLDLCIKKLRVITDVQLEIKGGKLYVSNLELQSSVRRFNCNITNLNVNDDFPEDISETITDEAPNFLQEYQDLISQYASRIVRNWINNILRRYTLANLFNMIGG